MHKKAPSRLVDRKGAAVTLSRGIATGGEGAIFELAADNSMVAKVYHSEPDAEKAAKLAALVAAKNDDLLKLAAWPKETLHARAGGPPVGFLMPRLHGYHDIHKLYGPKTRMNEFPGANWKFLVHSAANLARAFRLIHRNGHVIGDVNQGSVLVASNATVRLVDCDSFQITVSGRTYFCDVGVPTYQPPEFQDKKTFRGLVRTPNHDNFGLAILIFQLLFIARHPFCGRYSGSGEMPIERAIKEYRYAYGSAAHVRQMTPPPGALPREAVADHVAQFFERAFGPNGTKPGRPDADEWTKALDALEAELKVCDANSGHYYLKTLNGCPICAIERSAGVILFLPPLGGVQPGVAFNLASIWAQIEGVASPGPAAHVPQPTAARATGPAANAHDVKMLRRSLSGAIVLGDLGLWAVGALHAKPGFWLTVCAAIVAVFLWKWTNGEQRQAAKRHFDQVSGASRAMMEHWKQETGDIEFQRRKADLLQAKREYERLPDLRRQRLQDLERRKRQLQLEAFLDRFEIDKSKIPGIGPGRKAVLESNGIETAADVVHARITSIPGFGDSLAQKLIKWRQTIEQKFVFDPNKAIDRSAVAALENEINNSRSKFEDTLRKGQAELLRIRQTALAKRETIRPRLEEALREAAQAEVNYEAFG